MLTRNTAYVWTNADVTADTNLIIPMPDKARRVNVNYTLTLDAGATPVIQLELQYTPNGLPITLAATAVINATADGVLSLDFPPDLLRLNIDIGPVAQNWAVALYIDVFTEE